MNDTMKLGAFYKVYTFKGVPMLLRPIEESNNYITFYSIETESIFSMPKPVKNKIEFHKEAIKEELKQFRKCINKIYRDKFHRNFSGKFYLDTVQTVPSTISIETSNQYLNLSSNPKELRKKITEDILISIESKNRLDSRYSEVKTQFKNSAIKSERYNLNQLLKIIKTDRKEMRDKIKRLRQQKKRNII